jgi:hypothetical protein
VPFKNQGRAANCWCTHLLLHACVKTVEKMIIEPTGFCRSRSIQSYVRHLIAICVLFHYFDAQTPYFNFLSTGNCKKNGARTRNTSSCGTSDQQSGKNLEDAASRTILRRRLRKDIFRHKSAGHTKYVTVARIHVGT